MNGKLLTTKQFAALIFVSLLSPLLRSVPRASVYTAGRGAWLSVLPALFILLFLAAFLGFLIRSLRPGEGYADLFFRWLGPVAGRIVLLLYGLWFLVYAGFVLRTGAERLVAAVYPESPLFLFLLVMLALCLLTALGTLRAVGRTAFLIQSILLASLGLVLFLAAPDMSLKNLFPVPLDNTAGIISGGLPLAFIGALGACFPFLMKYVEPIKQPGKQSVSLVLGFLFLCLILSVEILGTFGPSLTQKLAFPFFLMVRNISLFHITQRIEAVVVVLWMFADFILCTSMLRCAYETFRPVFCLPDPETEPILSLRRGRWLLWAEAVVVLASCFLVSRSSFQMPALADRIIPFIGACYIYIGMPLCWCIGWLRGKTN